MKIEITESDVNKLEALLLLQAKQLQKKIHIIGRRRGYVVGDNSTELILLKDVHDILRILDKSK